MLDNVAVILEGGWRQLSTEKLKHEASVTSVNGAVTDGDDATKNDGGKRAFDMGGPFVGVALRFYVPPLN
jgi:hypothetical protein